MQAQQQITFAWSEQQVGAEFDVILDGPVPDADDVWIGRSYADAPEIDCLVYVEGEGLQAGEIVPVEVVAAQEYDLIARPVGEAR